MNSHQPWTGPVAWYEAHLHSEEGWDAVGGVFPGAPVILHGHNRDLGWAHTVNDPDLIDVYALTVDPDDPTRYRFDGAWRPFEERTADDRREALGPARWTVRREACGPSTARSCAGRAARSPSASRATARCATSSSGSA